MSRPSIRGMRFGWRAHLQTARATWLRVLPASIIAIGILLVLKLVTVFQGPGAPSVLVNAGRVMMPAAQAAAHEPPKDAAPEPDRHDAPAANKVAAPPAPPVDPAPSEAERSLLMDLRSRRTSLDDRARVLDGREALLAAAERSLSARVDQLGALQARLEQLEQGRRERDDANWRSLVKTYETMRPRDAATIFNELDPGVLLQVLDRMKEAKAAPILAAMQPERARTATADLVKWRTRVPSAAQP